MTDSMQKTGTAFNDSVHRDENGRFDRFFTAADSGAHPQLPGDRIVAQFVGEGWATAHTARVYAEHAISDAVRDGYDPELAADYIIGLPKEIRDQPFGVAKPADLHAAGVTADEFFDLAFRDEEKYLRHTRALLALGVTSKTIDQWTADGFPASPEAFTALGHLDEADALEWAAAATGNTALSEQLQNWPAVGQIVNANITLGEAVKFAEAGINPTILISTPTMTMEQVNEFSAVSLLDPDLAAYYVSQNMYNEARGTGGNVTAQQAGEFGSTFHPIVAARFLDAGIDPVVARSFYEADDTIFVDDVARLISGGITTGEQMREWQDALGIRGRRSVFHDSDYRVDEIFRVRALGLTPAEALDYRTAGFDSNDWKHLHDAGVTDAGAWARAARPERPNGSVTGPSFKDAQHITSWVRAGGTIERFTAARRAGIPAHELLTHLYTDDLWAAGATHRAESESYAKLGWAWPWNETTYQGE